MSNSITLTEVFGLGHGVYPNEGCASLTLMSPLCWDRPVVWVHMECHNLEWVSALKQKQWMVDTVDMLWVIFVYRCWSHSASSVFSWP